MVLSALLSLSDITKEKMIERTTNYAQKDAHKDKSYGAPTEEIDANKHWEKRKAYLKC